MYARRQPLLLCVLCALEYGVTLGGFIKDEYCSWVQYKSGPGGTPTKRQVSKRQVSKRLVSKRPVSKHQVYKTSGLQNVRFQNVWFQNVQFLNLLYLWNKKYRNCQVSIPI